jgi:uncharacterized repeat protein (TIGR03833 family)
MNNPGTRRAGIRPGMTVLVVLKQDQSTGKLTQGVVKDILTRSSTHPHGIKVRLESGLVGRVQQIVDPQAPQARTVE